MTLSRQDPLAIRSSAVLLTLVVLAPVLILLTAWGQINSETWQHLTEVLLPEVLWNTARLVVCVVVMATVLGVVLAWMVGCHEFPGRRFFRYALATPLVFPKYVMGFVFLSLIDYGGPLGQLDLWLGTHMAVWLHEQPWLPLSITLSLALYPYVYMLTLASIESQGKHVVEAAQVDGATSWEILLHVVIPVGLVGISGGVLLITMETLNDFGTVAMFSYDTFSVLVYKVWYGFFDLDTAAQLSFVLMLFVLPVLVARMAMVAKAPRLAPGDATLSVRIQPKIGVRSALSIFCGAICVIAVLVPCVQLVILVSKAEPLVTSLWPMISNTIYIAVCAAALTLVFATGNALLRSFGGGRTHVVLEFANLGYGIPGTILAIGVLTLQAYLMRWLEILPTAADALFAVAVSMGVVTMLGLALRHHALGVQFLWQAASRIHKSLYEAATLEGASRWQVMREIFFPLMRPTFWICGFAIFMESAKEMPITLMTRPFGKDTLAVKIFEYTNEGDFSRAAWPALILVALVVTPQVYLAGARLLRAR